MMWGQSLFGDWISGIKPGSSVSLYIHVPFCRRLCWFCACRTQGTQTDNPVIAYVDVLKAELDIAGRPPARRVTLSRLHWGGGTPTLLNPDLMRDLAARILDVVPLGPDAEFSVEIDPNEIDEGRLDALAEAGMNRASIGVQDFDDEIQKTIGRIQSYDTTRASRGHDPRAGHQQPERRHPVWPATSDQSPDDGKRAESCCRSARIGWRSMVMLTYRGWPSGSS